MIKIDYTKNLWYFLVGSNNPEENIVADTDSRHSLLKRVLDEAVLDSGTQLNDLLRQHDVSEEAQDELSLAVVRAARTNARRIVEE